MPFFWSKEGSNFVAYKFNKVAPEKAAETFASPAGDGLDPELVEYFTTTAIGDAIEVALAGSGKKSERSLKVSIGKHAKKANREVENKAVGGGVFMFRVSAILQESTNPTPSANGTEVTVVDTPLQATPEEATSRARGR